MNAEIIAAMTYLSVEDATTPTAGAVCSVDRWWAVHPEKGLMFYRRYSPQCNANPDIVRTMIKKMYPECEARHFAVVYIPTRLQSHDY